MERAPVGGSRKRRVVASRALSCRRNWLICRPPLAARRSPLAARPLAARNMGSRAHQCNERQSIMQSRAATTRRRQSPQTQVPKIARAPALWFGAALDAPPSRARRRVDDERGEASRLFATMISLPIVAAACSRRSRCVREAALDDSTATDERRAADDERRDAPLDQNAAVCFRRQRRTSCF